MQPRTIILIRIAILITCAVVTVYSMWHASGQTLDMGILGVMIWGISPYVCFFLATYLLERFTAISHLPAIGFVIALLMLGFTLFAYLSTPADTSSTSGLIFVFVPLCLFVGSFSLLVIGVPGSYWANKTK